MQQRTLLLYFASCILCTVQTASTTNRKSTPLDCPPGFLNVVFNAGADNQRGWESTTWDTLTSHGVTNWSESPSPPPSQLSLSVVVGFVNKSMAPIESKVPARTQDGQVRIVTDPDFVDGAISLLKSNNPPQYLELFNEPDYHWKGSGIPKTPPLAAAKALEPILNGNWPNTKLISPALAGSLNESWWKEFNGPKGCNGCMGDKIGIVAGHFYDPSAESAIDRIEKFAKMWKHKDVWITELAPSTRESNMKVKCHLDEEGMKHWMDKVLTAIVTRDSMKNVKKIFWNAGEWVSISAPILPWIYSLTFDNRVHSSRMTSTDVIIV